MGAQSLSANSARQAPGEKGGIHRGWSCLPLLLLAAASPLLATDYYVSPSGNDKNPGTESRPWKTIANVNKQNYSAGDRIFFQGGSTFSGNLTFGAASAGTPSSPITVTSSGSSPATISAGTGAGIMVYNTAGYVIQDLNLTGSGASTNTQNGVNIYTDLTTGVKLNTIAIHQVTVSGFGQYGIVVGSGSTNVQTGYENVAITNVTAHDNALGGIITYGPTDPTNTYYPHQYIYVGYDTVYNNLGKAGINHSGSGIVIGAANTATIEKCVAYRNGTNNTTSAGPVGIWAYDSTKVTIQYNESHHNHTSGASDGGGFDLDGGVSNSVLQYNYSHDNDGPGLLVTQYANARPQRFNTVRFNLSQNDARRNGVGGITLYNGGSGLSNVEIFNNTVFMAGEASATPYVVSILSGTTNAHFRNNIFFSETGANLLYSAAGQTGILFQGNDYWCDSAALTILWGFSSSYSSYSGLASWRSATGQETVNGAATGYSVDPLLTNAGGGGTIDNPGTLNSLSTLTAYELQTPSPMIGTGLNLQLLFGVAPGSGNFYGVAIPGGSGSGYNVGAY